MYRSVVGALALAGGAAVAAATPLSDVNRFRELCPQLMVGQTVGAGHFSNQEVPEQVNAMIERFLTIVARQMSTA